MRVLKFKRRIDVDKTIGNAHIKTFRLGSRKNDELKQWTELHCWYECDCQHCPLSWEDRGLEDVDCGCYVAEYGEEYPKTLLVCMLPRWIKKILLIRAEKRQEKEDLEYLEYLNKQTAESEDEEV